MTQYVKFTYFQIRLVFFFFNFISLPEREIAQNQHWHLSKMTATRRFRGLRGEPLTIHVYVSFYRFNMRFDNLSTFLVSHSWSNQRVITASSLFDRPFLVPPLEVRSNRRPASWAPADSCLKRRKVKLKC